MRPFHEALGSGVLLCDGAMGTMLYSKGIYINRCYDELNLSAPETVAEIHREYINAGAVIIETNTYGANRYKLAPFGLEDQTTRINHAGVTIARRQARGKAYVAGSMGRLTSTLLLGENLTSDDIRSIYAEQAEALSTAGADLIIIETISSLRVMQLAIQATRSVCDLPIIAQMTVTEEGATIYGDQPEQIAETLKALHVDVGGLNCSVGPQPMLAAIQRMAKTEGLRLSAQPNAGLPTLVEGRYIYLCSPEYMAEYARRFLAAGVSIVGGCCGTTPEHIRAIAVALKAKAPLRRELFEVQIEIDRPDAKKATVSREPTALERAIESHFVISVEIDPPRGVNVARVLQQAKELLDSGIDAINIADGPRASARMSPMILGHILESQVGIQTIVHFCCRDRNLVALQADLMAAHAAGLRNILLITGDPPKLGDYPASTAVFDVDSIGLVKTASNLNNGLDLAGRAISEPTGFFVGVGVNPGATDIEEELRRFEAKKQAGAHFAMTQPVYEPKLLEQFLVQTEKIGLPILVGILPLVSYRNAEFLHNEVPGMTVPDSIRERMRKASTGEKARELGVAIARDALEAAIGMQRVIGAYIIPPLGQMRLALAVAKGFAGASRP